MEEYRKWLKQHLNEAKTHYLEVCKLDDRESSVNGSSEYFEKAHQMFGYIAALEKCLKETQPKKMPKLKPNPKKKPKRS